MPEAIDEINCFISYHRPDNYDYLNVVDRLKSEIAGRFEASTGRRLNIFLDHDSIGWGEDWREKIRESVLGTTFFIPIISMRFFRSDMCREELTTYYENAKNLGVTELILPVVVAGGSQISSTHVNEDVRLIERLNYIPIEAEWEAGYESPEWRQVVNRMVRELTAALEKAESALEVRELATEVAQPEDDEDHPEAVPNLDELTSLVEGTTSDMTKTLSAMQDLATSITATSDELPPNATTTQQQAVWVKASKDIGTKSARFADAAARFERRANETDAMLRAVVGELRLIDNQTSRDARNTLLESTVGLAAFADNINSIDDLVGGLRVASMMNVSLRKALQPAIRGMQSTRIGMSIAVGWSDLGADAA